MGSEPGGFQWLQLELQNPLLEMADLRAGSCQIVVPEQVIWVPGLKKLHAQESKMIWH